MERTQPRTKSGYSVRACNMFPKTRKTETVACACFRMVVFLLHILKPRATTHMYKLETNAAHMRPYWEIGHSKVPQLEHTRTSRTLHLVLDFFVIGVQTSTNSRNELHGLQNDGAWVVSAMESRLERGVSCKACKGEAPIRFVEPFPPIDFRCAEEPRRRGGRDSEGMRAVRRRENVSNSLMHGVCFLYDKENIAADLNSSRNFGLWSTSVDADRLLIQIAAKDACGMPNKMLLPPHIRHICIDSGREITTKEDFQNLNSR